MTSKRLNRNYYLQAIKQHKAVVALLVAMTVTLPLFTFTALPPIEIVNEIPVETIEEITIPVEVNQTIQVEYNVTQEITVNETISVNITEGSSVFIDSQPIPPAIDSDIVLCIDTSGSMTETRMNMAIDAIKNLINVLNQSNQAGHSNDRISLVTFDAVYYDNNWTNDSTRLTPIDYISNQSHINNILNHTESLVGNGGTDIWAGLNNSLDILLFNPRNNSASLKYIILLTDGDQTIGPWTTELNTNNNYTAFMTLPANFTDAVQGGPYSESPIAVARNNDVKIFSIGLIDGTHPDYDEQFLRNISLDPTYGSNGNYFTGNDSLSLTESFLQSRDEASGWISILSNETIIDNFGTQQLCTFNVTKEVKRLKLDLNWINSSIDVNITFIQPNGTLIYLGENTTRDIVVQSAKHPKTIILDYPDIGVWQFNISWVNIAIPEIMKYRLSSFLPPISIDSVNQIDSLTNSSALFVIDISNKNPIFVYHNVTPYILNDFSNYNLTTTWNVSNIAILNQNSSVKLELNMTFLEPTLLQGSIDLKINCSEAYYDAYRIPITLDFRSVIQNITVDSYTVNETITIIEDQIIETTTYIVEEATVTGYQYDRELFDTFKWGGLISVLAILASFLAVYIKTHEMRLKGMVETFRKRLLPSSEKLGEALQRKGISISSQELENVLIDVDKLDSLGDNLFDLTGERFKPDELIELATGVGIEKIAQRLTYVTHIPEPEILKMLSNIDTIDEFLNRVNLKSDTFLDIITIDEDVVGFQSLLQQVIKIKSTVQRSIIDISDDYDIENFVNQMKRLV